MSEESSAPADDGGSDFEPITSQEALDKVIGQRIERVKKQYADYKDVKAKAERFDQLESASKTELQKLQERAAALESQLANEQLNSVRATVAVEKGVPGDYFEFLIGSTREELEAAADKLLALRGSPAKPPKSGLKSGASSSDRPDPQDRTAAAVRALFNQ